MEDGVREEHVGVVVATYGEEQRWAPLARRAVLSAAQQSVAADRILHVHGANLAGARNRGMAQMEEVDWIVFLDADDELDPHYIEHMKAGDGEIRQPSTLGVVNGVEDDFPVLIPPHPGGFMVGNHLIIGCMVRRDYVVKVGGFRDLPALEDWDLWIRCRLEGARVGTCPEAIYRVHVNPNSRNQNSAEHARTYADIQSRYSLDWSLKGFQ